MKTGIDHVRIFAEGLDHPECVAVHPDGSVWAGGEGGQIYRISPDGASIREVAQTGGFNLGIAFSPGARWLAICDNKNRCVWKYDLQNESLHCLATSVDGHRMRIPNYPVFDRNGYLYISDSGAFREVSGCIYKFDPEGKGRIWHKGPFSFANGMALSSSQDKLFIVCTWLPGVEQVEITKDGNPGERTVLVKMPRTCPDGIVLDEADNLYISCYTPNSIYRLAINGELTEWIHDWEAHTLSNPTNMAFGGKDKNLLYVANLGRWHISEIRNDTPGLSLHY